MDDWEKVPTNSGHLHYRHILSKTDVGLSAHNDRTFKKDALKKLLETLQNHMDFIHDKVLSYGKTTEDSAYKTALVWIKKNDEEYKKIQKLSLPSGSAAPA